jgi:hypothetical protein
MSHAECYQAIERELDRRGLDYEIHGLPGTEDIIHFEEYWLTNLPESTKLFPAMADADQAQDLDTLIVQAVQAHAAQDDTTAYYVVLCGAGWTAERVETLRQETAGILQSSIRLVIESLEAFTSHPE